jgi:2'-5' RNA ligase
MTKLLALDVAILPPPDVAARAVALSAALPEEESQGLRLGPEQRPHITLSQQFVREEEIETVLAHLDAVLAGQPALSLRASGGGKGSHSVWMTIEDSPALRELHERVMEAVRGLERPGGTPAAFVDGDGRVSDVLWVASYRLQSSFGAFSPHITLGHASNPPVVEPIEFVAATVAACHLGRFCACRRVLRTWTLTASGASPGS